MTSWIRFELQKVARIIGRNRVTKAKFIYSIKFKMLILSVDAQVICVNNQKKKERKKLDVKLYTILLTMVKKKWRIT